MMENYITAKELQLYALSMARGRIDRGVGPEVAKKEVALSLSSLFSLPSLAADTEAEKAVATAEKEMEFYFIDISRSTFDEVQLVNTANGYSKRMPVEKLRVL